MDLTPYVDSLRHDLASAAAAGGPDAAAAAERLALALDPAVRLTLMDALSQAAAEITSELDSGSVDVRLRGREPQFVVDVTTVPMLLAPPAPPTPPDGAGPDAAGRDEVEADDGSLTRLTLRLPEAVKSRAEELASGAGLSLNSWIVGAVRAATSDHLLDIDPPGFPNGGRGRPPERPAGPARGPRRMTGWV